MGFWEKIKDSFDFRAQCQEYNVRLWQCPQFLFLAMGIIIICSILATYTVAEKYMDPYIVSLIVLGTTGILFIIGYAITSSFERMAESSKQKSEFISIVSHRLRTPLSAIKWQIDLLSSKKINLDEDQINQSFSEIQSQNEKMIWIVNNLLDLTSIEGRNLVLYPSSFSLRDLTEEVIATQRALAAKANLEIFLESSGGVTEVFADRLKIKNIIFHLLDNAIRYSTRKGKITIALEKEKNFFRFKITDEGVGIHAKDIKKIFSKFFRSREILSYQTEGTGIGLYLCKMIIEKSGGKIGFESEEGKGSTFWFTLSIKPNNNV